jgi:phosphoribosyl 1,2-cyclic phosphodiesterase
VRFSLLGSGSAGNATLVECDGTRVLVDAGFSARDLARRLRTLGVDPASLDGIVITHDHGDHTRGMGVFARRHGTPLFLTERTRAACASRLRGVEAIVPYRPGRPFAVGTLRIEPFLTVHDAADPVGVAVVDDRRGLRLGLATDLGRPTAQIRHALSACDALILEANHDDVLLHQAPYPVSVKARIRSSHGHLSNEAAARFALELLHPRLVAVVLAHLSRESNHPELARDVVGRALRDAGWRGHLEVAHQDEPTGPLDVEEIRRRSGPPQLSFL